MYRVLALLLIPALIAIPGAGSLLHTHAYTDHDHPEHHHGLAAHEHYEVRAHPDDNSAHLEGCDPGKHVVRFSSLCVAVPQVHVVVALFNVPALSAPSFRPLLTVRYPDVRVHGPPPHPQSPPRAPPLTYLA
ncbi:MAG TPA: hypothetical protein VH701_12145 [Vicinamibacterales bacterium]